MKIVYCFAAFMLLLCETSFGINKLGCLGIGILDWYLPGVGSAVVLRQWEKPFTLFTPYYLARKSAREYTESEYYQDRHPLDEEMIPADQTESGEKEYWYFFNKETAKARSYYRLSNSFRAFAVYDLYQSGCQPDVETDTYPLMLAPVRFDKFYNDWMFWVRLGIHWFYSELTNREKVKKRLFLGRGLKSNEWVRDETISFYFQGTSEEMLHRGIIQNYMFESLQRVNISPRISRHLAVLGGAAVFGLSHENDPSDHFWSGVYYGYMYHRSLDEFNLLSAAATHAWMNTLTAIKLVLDSDVHESDEDVEITLLYLGFSF